MRMWRAFRGVFFLMLGACSPDTAGDEATDGEAIDVASDALGIDPIGLALRFEDGVPAPITFVGEPWATLRELDITSSITTPDDQGIDPIVESGELASLDWTGVTQVEEIWVPSLDGTFTRERYYRNARWMERASAFVVLQRDAAGRVVGLPIIANVGTDDTWRKLTDDFFVRRFVARQLAIGCPSFGDCAGATFVAEGLVQARYAQKSLPVPISRHTTELALFWTEDLSTRTMAVGHVPRASSPYGYGLDVTIAPITAPSNGSFYVAGEAVSFQVTYRDGAGNRLHPPGSLPSYAEFFFDAVPSGLRYADLFRLQSRLYYASKHREGTALVVLSGPIDRLRTPETVVDPLLFFGPQVPFAHTAVDGYAAAGLTIPPAAIVFGGAVDPTLWTVPTSDTFSLTIPADATPGTYVIATKMRREFGGEGLVRGATTKIQVGQLAPTSFVAKTGCAPCHTTTPSARFDRILHGIGDRSACFGCHASLGIEIDNAIDIRVHTIHDRSDRYPRPIGECNACHLQPPVGPARGL